MCGVIFGMDCARIITPHLNWTVPLPPDHRPEKVARKRRVKRSQEYSAASTESPATVKSDETQSSQEQPKQVAASNSSPVGLLSVVQITDVHIDPYYVAGMNAQCGEPLCCRPADGYASTGGPGRAAGAWGDYGNCECLQLFSRSHTLRVRVHVCVCVCVCSRCPR